MPWGIFCGDVNFVFGNISFPVIIWLQFLDPKIAIIFSLNLKFIISRLYFSWLLLSGKRKAAKHFVFSNVNCKLSCFQYDSSFFLILSLLYVNMFVLLREQGFESWANEDFLTYQFYEENRDYIILNLWVS